MTHVSRDTHINAITSNCSSKTTRTEGTLKDIENIVKKWEAESHNPSMPHSKQERIVAVFTNETVSTVIWHDVDENGNKRPATMTQEENNYEMRWNYREGFSSRVNLRTNKMEDYS